MGVPLMTLVNAGLIAVYGGGLLLLIVALWWSWAGDGVRVPREQWPPGLRLGVIAGWAFLGAGIVLQLAGYVSQVGVTRWGEW